MRVPKILDDTVAANSFDTETLARLRALRDELTGGTLRALVDDDGAGDKAQWDSACAPHVGHTWLDIPWYFAESYFYRRLLEATRFFVNGRDPFLSIKQAEEREMLPKLAAARAALPVDDDARLRALTLASLWGNRADLSYAVGRAYGDAGGADDLVVDQRERAHTLLSEARAIAFLLDNAGTELAFDLVLAHELERRGKPVVLFCKGHPFFVSDAVAVDVERTARLLELPAPSTTLSRTYFTSSGFFFRDAMPADFVQELAGVDVVIVKGDANYRRLVGDAPWPHDTPVDVATAFPAPFIALRTLKAEVAVGVAVAVAARAKARDPDWLVSGRFGMVQVG